jgi:hypothetical protein
MKNPLVHWQDRDVNKGRMARRAYPIHAYVGPNGTGKSFVLGYDTITSLEWGRPVLSTVRILDYNNPRLCPGGSSCDDPPGHLREAMRTELLPIDPNDEHSACVAVKVPTGLETIHRAAHPLYSRFTDYQQLLELRDSDCLMDEVTGIASSRDSMSGMPTQVANLLVQLRRRNVVLRWSAPSWGRADKIIREVSQAVTLTSARMPKKAPAVEGEPPRLWSERRLFIAKTYSGEQFDEFSAHRAFDLKPMVKQYLWGPGSLGFSVYDTYEPVTSLGWAQESGLCGHCGGHRARRKCSCADTEVNHGDAATERATTRRTRRARAKVEADA